MAYLISACAKSVVAAVAVDPDYHGSLGDPNEDAFDQPTQEADSTRGK